MKVFVYWVHVERWDIGMGAGNSPWTWPAASDVDGKRNASVPQRVPANEYDPGRDVPSVNTPAGSVVGAAGGTSPGTDEAGVSVWIPLASPAA